MTYTVLPNSGQSLGVTRIPINTNFSLIQSVFAQNHVGFNIPGNSGKHKFLQMPVQGAAPTTIANEGAFYAKTQTADAQAFWRFQTNGTELQITNNTINLIATPGAVPLMGGMTLQWGNGSFANGATVSFFTSFTSVVNIQVTIADPAATSAIAFVRTFTQADFVLQTNTGVNPVTIFWMAFGFL